MSRRILRLAIRNDGEFAYIYMAPDDDKEFDESWRLLGTISLSIFNTDPSPDRERFERWVSIFRDTMDQAIRETIGGTPEKWSYTAAPGEPGNVPPTRES